MITYTINDTEKQLRNKLSEIKVLEFEQILYILNNESDFFDKYINIFSVLGMSTEDIETITPKEFIKITKEFNISDWNSTEFIREVTVDGKKYQSFTGDKFVLSIRDLAKIEKYIKLDKKFFFGELLAIIYKDHSVSKELWYTESTIKDKAKLFRDHLTADIILPYVNIIVVDIMTKINSEII